jgi:hypothetical protein
MHILWIESRTLSQLALVLLRTGQNLLPELKIIIVDDIDNSDRADALETAFDSFIR